MGKIKCLILAAGKGTRMASDLPKVLHKVCDKPMVVYPLQAAAEAGAEESCVIIGYKGSLVKNEVIVDGTMLYLGENSWGDPRLKFSMDELTFTNRALSAKEIEDTYINYMLK